MEQLIVMAHVFGEAAATLIGDDMGFPRRTVFSQTENATTPWIASYDGQIKARGVFARRAKHRQRIPGGTEAPGPHIAGLPLRRRHREHEKAATKRRQRRDVLATLLGHGCITRQPAVGSPSRTCEAKWA